MGAHLAGTVGNIAFRHHVCRDKSILGDKVCDTGECTSVAYRIAEKPVNLTVRHRLFPGIYHSLEEKIGLFELVIEEAVALRELEVSKVIFLDCSSPEHIESGEQPAPSAFLLIGNALGYDAVAE